MEGKERKKERRFGGRAAGKKGKPRGGLLSDSIKGASEGLREPACETHHI